MIIIDVSKKTKFEISWKEEIKRHFSKELGKMYTPKIYNDIISTLKFRSILKLDNLLLYWKGRYFKVTETGIIEEVKIRDILPISNIENKYLNNLFNSKNWADIIEKRANLSVEEITDVQIFEDKILLNNNKGNKNLEKILSEYVTGEKKETIKETLLKILKEEEDRYLRIRIQNTQFYLYEKSDCLELKLRKELSIRNQIMITIKENFYDIQTVEIDNLLTKLLNEFLYGIVLKLPIRLTDVKGDILQGEIWYKNNWYPCENLRGYSKKGLWIIKEAVPFDEDEDVDVESSKYKAIRYDEIFKYDYMYPEEFCETMKKYNVSPFQNLIFKSEFSSSEKDSCTVFQYDGKELLVEYKSISTISYSSNEKFYKLIIITEPDK